MQFDSFEAFLNMGGYAFYVWLAYGLTLICLGGLIFLSHRQQHKVLTDIAKKMAREERLKENRSAKA